MENKPAFSQKLKQTLKENWFLLLFLGAIIGAFVMFHTTPTAVASTAELNATLSDGQPTVIEFYSNF